MKSIVFFVVLLCALVIGSVSWETKASNATRKQSAITTFNQPVLLHGVVMQGEYLFVHDDAAMARGEACTYIYKGNSPRADKLVASFHCIPVMRAKAKNFITRTTETSPGTMELKEFQFSGDTEAHAVPTSIDQHVAVKR